MRKEKAGGPAFYFIPVLDLKLISTLAESLSVVSDPPLVLIDGVVVGPGVVLTGVVAVPDWVDEAGEVVVGVTVVPVLLLPSSWFEVEGVVVLLPRLS